MCCSEGDSGLPQSFLYKHMNKLIKNSNWKMLVVKKKVFMINVVNSIQLELDSPIDLTNYLLEIFEKEMSLEKAITIASSKFSDFSSEWIEDFIAKLTKYKILNTVIKKSKEFTEDYLLGMDRQINFLNELNNGLNKYQNQLILKNAKVGILGLGSVSHYTIMSLVASGVGSFVCVDFDSIDKRNMGRQPIFKNEDLGKYKTEVIEKFILESREGVKVKTINKKLSNQDDVQKAISGCDVVIHHCDLPRFLIHRWINKACLELKIPSILCYSGRVGPFCIPFKTACYGCLEIDMKKRFSLYEPMVDEITNGPFTRFPELAVVGPLSGTLVAKEIVAYLLKMKPETFNAFLDINPFDLKITHHKLSRQSNCRACVK